MKYLNEIIQIVLEKNYENEEHFTEINNIYFYLLILTDIILYTNKVCKRQLLDLKPE